MQAMQSFIFGPTPQERVKKWQQKLKSESRMLDREVRQLELAQTKAYAQLKQLAMRGEAKNARLLAREVVRSRAQKDRLATSKARLNSISMELQHQLATLKITGALQKSTEIMRLSSSLVKLPQLNATMRNMSFEMMKAGIISEMVEETLEGIDEDECLEEEADAEVEKVLFEITDGKLGQVGRVSTALPTTEQPVREDEEEEHERMQAQLNELLRS